MMKDNTLGTVAGEATAIEHISFTSFIKEKYDCYRFFLPKEEPSNDRLSVEELKELERLINDRDHFEIRREIAKRFNDCN